MIVVEEQQNNVEEMEWFNEQLKRMLLFNYTHTDIDFCNSTLPKDYLPNLLQSLLTQRNGLSYALKRNLHFLEQRLRVEPNYKPKWAHMPFKPVFPEYQDSVRLIVDADTDVDSPDLAAQILKKVGMEFYIARLLDICISNEAPADVILKLPRYLATVLKISLRKSCHLYIGRFSERVDCTPLIMLSNLFQFQFCFQKYKGEKFGCDLGVLKRLLHIGEHNVMVAGDRRANHKQFYLDKVEIDISSNLAAINKVVESSTHVGMLYSAHKLRMFRVVREFRSDGPAIEWRHFNLYLESVVSLTILARKINSALVGEIFNDKVICADFFDVIQIMHHNNLSLKTFMPYLADLVIRDKRSKVPRGSGWEALFVASLQDEIKDDVRSHAAILALIKNFARKKGSFSGLAVYLFESAVNVLGQDANHSNFFPSIKSIIKYLRVQKQLNVGLEASLLRLFVLLLASAQRCIANSLDLLRCYVLELLRLNAVEVLTKILNKLISPRNERDSEDNYYSMLALARVLCLMVDDELVLPYVEKIEAMPETESTKYAAFLQLYVGHYEQVLIEKFNKKQSAYCSYYLLKVYHFEKTKMLKQLDRIVLENVLLCAVENINPKNDLNTDLYLVVSVFSDVFTFDQILELYVRFHLQNDHYFQEIAREVYSVLLELAAESQASDIRQNRLCALIMLIYQFDLPDQPWWYFTKLMGLQGGDKALFQKYTAENPEAYCLAMLQVAAKFKSQFKGEQFPNNLLHDVLNVCVDVLKWRMLEENLERSMIQLLQSMNLAEVKTMLKMPEDAVRYLITLCPGDVLRISATDKNFSYDQIRRILKGIQISELDRKNINELLYNLAGSAINLNLISLLLHFDVDFCYSPFLNEPCTLEKSIRSNTDLIRIVCNEIINNHYQFNFEKLHALCRDPLGLAVCSGASLELVQLMIRAGFDFKRYDPHPDWHPPLNLAPHNYISGLQAQHYRAQQRGTNAAQITLGFINESPADSQPTRSNTIKFTYLDPRLV